ncbi:MAG: SDR family oxidoreductase [Propionibacteriaceae bacterium]|nr:SDR family oxidoreductase [Propionibacteriaceae bacterium]
MNKPLAVVTGASSGIGAATARKLAAIGYEVVCAARRTDRIQTLADEIGGRAQTTDITNPQSVAALAASVGPRLDVLVNDAGGAIGLEPIGQADLDAWQKMFDVNVLGAARVTKALLPALMQAAGIVVFVTSTAADHGYENAAGSCGAKAAERAMVQSMRLELYDTDVRVTEISPGMVHTEEFSLVRFHGDQARADATYRGLTPLSADDIGDAITYMVTRPHHVNVDRLTIRPRAQAAHHRVWRT